MPRALPASVLFLLAACNQPATAASADASATSTAAASSSDASTTLPPTSGATSTAAGASATAEATTAAETTAVAETTTAAASTGDVAGTTGEPAPGLRYDEVRQKSAHNSFQRDETLIDALVYHRIRSLELDIHHSAAFAPELPGDWYVYHVDVVDDASHCRTLSACLAQLAAFQRAVPEHEALTVWLDLKDPFIADHQPADLDAGLQAAFGERLLRPAELLARCPGAATLQDAVTLPGCGWPELAQLRGRVLVALTGGGLDDPDGALATYLGAEPTQRAAFVAPDLGAADQLHVHPAAIFHNLELGDVALATAVHAAGLVSRVWVLDDADAWASAEQAGAHHLASNKVNAEVDPWASTRGPGGWPFRCLADCDPPTGEPGPLLAVDVDSGDLWGASDAALFAHVPVRGAVAVRALIGVASSHVEPWAKACLAARQGTDPGAPYLAICRPADAHPLSVQLRASPGAATEAVDLDAIADLDAETPAFVRLELEPGGLCARGLGSADGETWIALAEHCFAAPLTHVGLTASSHDAGPLRLLFVDLRRDPGGPLAAADLTVTPLGQAAGAVQDGL